MHTQQLADALVQRGHSVGILQYNHRIYEEYARPGGEVQFATYRSPRKFRDITFAEADAALAVMPARVIVVPTAGIGFVGNGFSAIVRRRRQRATQIVHSMPSPRPLRPNGLPPWRGRALWWKKQQLYERWTGLAFQRVVAVSRHIADALAREYGISRKRVCAILSGVDTNHFCPNPFTRDETRSGWNVRDDTFAVGCVGRVHFEQKRTDAVIRAFADFRTGISPRSATLIIAGSGPDLADAKILCESLGISDDVRFLGLVKEVHQTLAGLDAFVLASPNEGLCLALAEAMSTQLPCVVCSAGGALELAYSDDVAWRVPVETPELIHQALVDLYIDRDARDDRSMAARQHILNNHDLARQLGLLTDLLRAELSQAS